MGWELLWFFATPLVRSSEGWLKNSLQDGKINAFEYRELAVTTVRVLIIQGALYLSLQGFYNGNEGDISIIATGAASLLVDKILSALKKK